MSSSGGWAPAAFAVGACAAVGGLLYLQALSIERAAEKAEAAAKKLQDQAAQARDARSARGARASGSGPAVRAAPPPDAAGAGAASASEPPADCAGGDCGAHSSAKQDAQQQHGDEAPRPAGGCAHCGGAPAAGRALLWCTSCREVKYCSDKCQAAAWPGHKEPCRAAMMARKAAMKARKQQAAAAADSGDQGSKAGAATDEARARASGDAAARAAEPSEVLAALGGLVQRHADGLNDALQRAFEMAVVQFVQGEAQPAAAALAKVAACARAEQRPQLAADALRWLGHANTRLGAPARAAAAFAEGAALATAAGSKRLQVECLSGLGVVHRGQGQSEAAVAYLRQALAVAESVEGGGGPLRAGVLVNLATALMASDTAEAAGMLEEAVGMREQQVIELDAAGERNGLATAIMEHASALVTLAAARYGCHRYPEARDAYARALEVFEMVGDDDKVVAALVSLANLHELQLEDPGTLETAAGYRRRLFHIARQYGRGPPEACAICLQGIEPLKPCAADAPVPAKAAAAAARAASARAGSAPAPVPASVPAPVQAREATAVAPAAGEPEANGTATAEPDAAPETEAPEAAPEAEAAAAPEAEAAAAPEAEAAAAPEAEAAAAPEAEAAAAPEAEAAAAPEAEAAAAPEAEAAAAPEAEAAAASEAEAAAAPEAEAAAAPEAEAGAAATAVSPEAASGPDDEAPRDQRGAAADGSALKAGRLIMLPCLHVYHHGCFSEWSSHNENASCPSCKQPAPL
ncbi:hypothetical protein Rsub_10821 [Raphidocelis subcapitata]|uniref:MYND-type domain-containing protein n=1 Tax=Raphidocelis subcapitata TaxID=307507 RepID=A0A2V0PHX5_9CHLO|nr:hypothetical protein Rsub_10821 [Raphidocelis subcapitata]|eukprot:GBF98632.1 hypothetical protein Rsub_10821 [Raphidocelis subcapitata]